MESMCEKQKARGRCDNNSVKKQCWKACGGSPPEEDHPEEPKPVNKPASKPASKPAPSPVANNNNNKNSQSHHGETEADANAHFLARCQAAGEAAIKSSCHSHCVYGETTAVLKKAFLGGPCSLNQLRAYLTAASNSKDNTQCCVDAGLLSQKKTGNCGCFCNPTGPVWPGKGEAAKYAGCVGVLEGIMNCHKVGEMSG